MLRAVDALLHPEEFNTPKWLYRGMKNMTVDAQHIKRRGGTQRALMSTTENLQVALTYSQSTCPLVFKYKAVALTRGASLCFLSLYPKEAEVLYPPLTLLRAEDDPYELDGVTFLEISPQLSNA
jgi:hypothetical protein